MGRAYVRGVGTFMFDTTFEFYLFLITLDELCFSVTVSDVSRMDSDP